MCHFVTIGISGGSGSSREIFRTHTLHAEPAANPYVRAAMSGSGELFDITVCGCSCSIYSSSASDGFEEEAERARYARKGWSAAKISRAIASKQTASELRKINSRAQQFSLCVEAFVQSGARVSLVSHFYNASFAEEVVQVNAQLRMSLGEFLDAQGAFPEDTLVTVE